MSLYNLLYPDNMGVRHFDAGGATTTTTTAPAAGAAPVATGVQETTVSNWAAPVVGGIVNAAIDAAGNPYQVYGGKTVAGASDLQNKAFTGVQNLTGPNTAQTNATTNMQDVYKSAATQPAYTGTTFTSNTTGINNQFDQNALNSYMNPYLSTILNPQLAEARRNAGIEQVKNQANLIKTGGFGGGGGNLLAAENQRNLGTRLADITGKGYENAYSAAQTQYNADQNRLLDALKAKEQSGQFGSNQGLNYLKLAGETAQDQGNFGNNLAINQLAANKQMADLGDTQRDITQQGLTSDYNLFKEQRDYPKTQIDWLNSVIKNYPMTTTNFYGEPTSALNSTVGGALTGLSLLERLNKLSGQPATKTTT
jgi:hypothetical protein